MAARSRLSGPIDFLRAELASILVLVVFFFDVSIEDDSISVAYLYVLPILIAHHWGTPADIVRIGGTSIALSLVGCFVPLPSMSLALVFFVDRGIAITTLACVCWLLSLSRNNRRLIEEAAAFERRRSTAKSEFLANLVHDMRSPLNAIIGYSEFMLIQPQLADDPAKRRDYLDTIQRGAHHLLSLVNDLLDLSKLEAGSARLEFERLEARGAIDEALSLVLPTARAKEIELVVGAADAVLEADRRALIRMLVNLLSNAVRFTDPGGIVTLTAERVGATVRLEIDDTGCGVPEDLLARLALPFDQDDARFAPSRGGTGLGLHIVKRLMDLHGGTLEVASTPGRGSRFTLVFAEGPRGARTDSARDRAGRAHRVRPDTLAPQA